ncbi:MAG: heavy-metal-associated domain-containing protein [Gemmatimonadetes bacterium]|nr:heavy-metal-associated domain-containing protein [Gemmatimonadota bacterium]
MSISGIVGFFSSAAIGAAAVLCPLCGGGPGSAAAQQPPDTAVARFAVSGMTCGSCATTARLALQRLHGVYQATVSYDSSSAEVRYDPRQATPAGIAEHLERMTGYRATSVGAADSLARRRAGR